MSREKNTHGGGANTNKNGLKFEQNKDLKDSFEKQGFTATKLQPIVINNKKDRNYKVYEISKNEKVYGYVMQKHNLYRHFGLKEKVVVGTEIKEKWETKISKQLLPDEAFYNVEENKLYIIEKKFQDGAGSVDEKLQTSGFKLYEYNKLFADIDSVKDINFYYLLSDFFKSDKYSDVIEYIKSNEHCNAFFDELPLESIGISIDSD